MPSPRAEHTLSVVGPTAKTLALFFYGYVCVGVSALLSLGPAVRTDAALVAQIAKAIREAGGVDVVGDPLA